MSDFSRKIRSSGHAAFTSPPGNHWLALGPGCHLGAGQVLSSLPQSLPLPCHLPINTQLSIRRRLEPSLPPWPQRCCESRTVFSMYFCEVLFCVHVILVCINCFMLYVSFSSFIPTLSTRPFTSISLSWWLCVQPVVCPPHFASPSPQVDPDPASSIHPPHHKKCCREPPHTCPLMDLAGELLGLYTQKQNHWVEGCVDS